MDLFTLISSTYKLIERKAEINFGIKSDAIYD